MPENRINKKQQLEPRDRVNVIKGEKEFLDVLKFIEREQTRKYRFDHGTFDEPKGMGGHLYFGMAKAIKEFIDKQPQPVKSRFAKRTLKENFIPVLQKKLYEKGYTFSETLIALVRMNRLRAICNYNFDDLVERCPTGNGLFLPIACAADRMNSESIPVYHIHGFIPSDYLYKCTGDIVFSEDDYHMVYQDFFHWSNTVQLTLFRESTCLLTGLSCEDPNLRRLLDVVKGESVSGRRYVVMRYPGYPELLGSYAQTAFDAVKGMYSDSMEELGVKVLWIEEFDPEIAFLLESITHSNPGDFFIRKYVNNIELELEKHVGKEKCATPECNNSKVEGAYYHYYCKEHTIRDWQISGRLPKLP